MTDEVIRLANDTRQGLASYFYAADMNNIWKVAEALEYGMVHSSQKCLTCLCKAT